MELTSPKDTVTVRPEIAIDEIQGPKVIREEHISLVAKSNLNSIDLEWENLTISATTLTTKMVNGKQTRVKEEKVILDNISGSVKHGKFTAIMGPSGSGKTTLLNFLSARIDGKNLAISGDLRVNSEPVNDLEQIGNLVAYVMQDDILMGTSTPREAFTFTANLRLNHSAEEKKQRVEELLKNLGLLHCANTKIGNVLIRGISGGERKRTSIGVELITNPSMLFLDEPTTGLDSATSLNLLHLLESLAKEGRTVVSTIHQPNSEIYNGFDNLLLLVRGSIIYQGKATEAVGYFANIGFPCPKFSNPADYFMKIMNESGLIIDSLKKNPGSASDLNIEASKNKDIEEQFKDRVNMFVQEYRKSPQISECQANILTTRVENKNIFQVSWLTQMLLIFQRSLVFEIRNPMDVRMKLFQNILFGCIMIAVFHDLGTGQAGVQDRQGVLFFLSLLAGFGAINGSLHVFSLERPIYIRERLSKSYQTSAYFWGKACAETPFLILYPTIIISLVYFSIGLNTSSGDKFAIALAINIMSWLSGSAFGLCMSTFIPRIEVAMALVPALVVPFMLFAGFFVNQSNIPYFFYEFEYISIFKYGYQALIQNEFTDLNLANCNPPSCDPLGQANFHESIGLSIGLMACMAVGLRILAYFGLVTISTPKRPKIARKVAVTSR